MPRRGRPVAYRTPPRVAVIHTLDAQPGGGVAVRERGELVGADGDTVTLIVLESLVAYGNAGDVISVVQTAQVDSLIARGYLAYYSGPITPVNPSVAVMTGPQQLTLVQQEQAVSNLDDALQAEFGPGGTTGFITEAAADERYAPGGTAGNVSQSQVDSRYAVISLNGNGTTDNLPALNAALAANTHVSLIPSPSGGTVVGISGKVVIPVSVTLDVHPALTLKLLATGSNSAQEVVQLSNGSKLICRGTLDGNLAARGASGEMTTYCWGVAAFNVSNARADVDLVTNVGGTAAYIASNGESDGGAAIIGMDSTATAAVTNNVLKVNRITGSTTHGFMVRIRSDFNGVAEGDLPYYCEHNTIHAPTGPGGVKNCIEIVGPQTRYNDIYGGVAYDPSGQGGIECDFGAYGNTYHDPTIVFTAPLAGNTLGTFDAFTNRTSDVGDGKLKITRGNRWVHPRLIGGTLTGTMNINFVGAWGVGTDVTFEDPEWTGASAGGGSGMLVGIVLSGSLAKIDRVKVVRPRVEGVHYGLRMLGSAGIGTVEVSGGHMTYLTNGVEATGVTIDRLIADTVTWDGTATALNLPGVSVADVFGCTFNGQTDDTIIPPSAWKSVLRFGRCVFNCATSSGVPVRGPSTGQGYILDLGGSVYTTRVPGAGSNGSQGRVRASGANVYLGDKQTTAETRAIARTTAQPTSGTWLQNDEWEQVSPTAGSSLGGMCITPGTYGTYSSTATGTSGSTSVTVASSNGLRAGEWVSIVGGITYTKVHSVSGTTLTLVDPLTGSVTNAAITHVAPTWKALPAIAS